MEKEVPRNPLFKEGDKVRIINYGQAVWENKIFNQTMSNFPIIEDNETYRWVDIRRDLVGKEGIIINVTVTQNVPQYSISGIGSWYGEKQLELI